MKKKSLNKNIILNVIKALLSVLFPFISFPYISRILGPEQLGRIQFSQSIVAFALILASMGISAYALREGSKIKNDKEKITQFASEIFTINLLFSLLSFILLLLLINLNSKIGLYKNTLLILSLQIAFTSIGLDWLLNVYEDFLYSTIRFAILQIMSLIMMFTIIKTPSDVNKYAVIIVVANTGAYILNYFYTKKYVKLHIVLDKKIFRHLQSLLILFSNDVAQQVYINSDTILLGYVYGDSATGIYSTAVKIYSVVKKLINAAIMAAIPRLASFKEEEKYKKLITDLILYSALILSPAMMMMLVCSKEIINIVSGPEYIAGTNCLRIIAVALIFSVYANIFCNGILIIQGDEKKVLKATFIASIVNVSISMLLLRKIGIEAAAISTVLAEMIVCIYAFPKASKYINVKKCEKGIVKTILGALIIPIMYRPLRMIINKDIIFVLLFGTISGIAYLIVERLLKNSQLLYLEIVVREKIKLLETKTRET